MAQIKTNSLKNSYKFMIFLLVILFSSNLKSQVSYSESFESDFGPWVQLSAPDDDIDWLRTNQPSPHYPNGPAVAQNLSSYIAVQGHYTSPKAIIEANFDLANSGAPILSFYYFIQKDTSGFLEVQVLEGVTWKKIWNPTNFEDNWQKVTICLSNYQNQSSFRIRFVGRAYTHNDIGLDNIQINSLYINSIVKNNISPCAGDNNGSITINATGGIPTLQYCIDGINFFSTNVFNNLTAKAYFIKVKDALGCEVNGGTVVLTQPPSIQITNVTATHINSCWGDSTGSISIVANGGTGALSYSIDSGATYKPNNLFENLKGGKYYVFVRDESLCKTTTAPVIIDQPNKIVLNSAEITHITGCNGDNTGEIKIFASGGTTPVEYKITGKDFQYSPTFSNLVGGNYKIYLRDVRMCYDSSNIVAINQPAKIAITNLSHTNVTSCFGDANGTISVTATGGIGVAQYSINNYNYNTTGNFAGLIANNYTIYVKDQNGCINSDSTVILTQPAELLIDSVVSVNITGCYSNLNGEIRIYAHGGTPNLQYSINNGQTYQASGIFPNLGANTYNVKVSDVNNCTKTGPSITLSQPDLLFISSVNKFDVTSCSGGNNGKIIIIAYGGTLPLKYSIDSGNTWQSDPTFNDLEAGTYNIKVWDQNNCSVFWEPVIISEPSEIVISDVSHTTVSCFGGNNASITVQAHGGSNPLLYSINNGTSYWQTNIINGLYAGEYTIIVMDSHGCIANGPTFEITQPPAIIIDSVVINHINTCYGNSDGSITIYASGGTPPLSYSINSGGTYQSDSAFNNLPAGFDYWITVRDANQCIKNGSNEYINQPYLLTFNQITHTNVNHCAGSATGSITISGVQGGLPPYYYSIDSAQTFYPNNIFVSLYAGTYDVWVKDSHNCLKKGYPIQITEPTQINGDSILVKDIRCHGLQNGEIKIYAHGGVLPYKYSIKEVPEWIMNNTFTGLLASKYYIRIKDAYNCEYIYDTVFVNCPDSLILNLLNHENINSCYGNAEGSISLQALGGIRPYKYSVNGDFGPFSYDSIFYNLPSKVYHPKVKDFNNCEAYILMQDSSEIVHITQPPLITALSQTFTHINCNGNNDGTITIVGTGGTGTLSYSIDSAYTFSDSGTFTNLSPGRYFGFIRDENNCTQKIYNYTLNEPPILVIENMYVTDIQCHNTATGKIKVEPFGGNGGYQYNLNDGEYQISNIFDSLWIGSFFVGVIDSKGCTVYSDTITLTMPPNKAIFSLDTLSGCSPLTIQTQPSPLAVMNWSFGDGSFSSFVNPSHTYHNLTDSALIYTVTGYSFHQGCQDTFMVDVTIYSQPSINFTISDSVLFYPDTIITIQNNSNSDYTNYIWNFGDGNESTLANPLSHCYSTCGDYTLNVTAKHGDCSSSASKNVKVYPNLPSASMMLSNIKGCVPLTVELTNISTNSVSYRIDFGDGTVITPDTTSLIHVYDTPGIYYIHLSAFGDCNTVSDVYQSITVYEAPISTIKILAETDTFTVGQVVNFGTNSSQEYQFLWYFGDSTTSTIQNPSHIYELEGDYDVSLRVNSTTGCWDSITIPAAVKIIPKPSIKFPTAFKPGSKIPENIFFTPIAKSIKTYEIWIYNRNGIMVYHSTDLNEGWDGNGGDRKPCPPGVYVWKAVGKTFSNEYYTFTGNVTLFR